MSEFQKEKRYLVLKLSHLTDHQKTAIGAAIAGSHVTTEALPECVVVEHDWPNYDETWATVQAVAEGKFVSRDALAAQVGAIKKAWWDAGSWPNTVQEKTRLANAIESTPAPCLAQVKADAVKQALNFVGYPCAAHESKVPEFTKGFNFAGDQISKYADKLQEGGVK